MDVPPLMFRPLGETARGLAFRFSISAHQPEDGAEGNVAVKFDPFSITRFPWSEDCSVYDKVRLLVEMAAGVVQLLPMVQFTPLIVVTPLPGSWLVVAAPLRVENAGCIHVGSPPLIPRT